MLQNQQSLEMSRYILIGLFLASSIVCPSEGRCRNRDTGLTGRPQTECQVERKEFTFTYAGCEPISVCLNVCRGLCPTHTLVSQEPPYSTQVCTCCKPTSYKRQKVVRTVNCTTSTGAMQEERKELYLLKILECGCRNCY